ncbi:uncharacterized protein LOC132739358 [Ruditapes philippinarum]|uniref:uncharacterized protein LOC132739358 n=1 Tax=Ruditapes philippinarum TaxID=129788 RepID=UPI00295B235E|nr:uncharacterized protein LOC132739358 [Ruditapes philippinarum]
MLKAWLLILFLGDIKFVLSDEPLSPSYFQELLLEKMTKIDLNVQKVMERYDKIDKEKEQENNDISRFSTTGQKVLLVKDLEKDGWNMVFRATSSNGQNVFDAWTKGIGICSDKPKSMVRSYSSHYRNNVVSNWANIGVKYVKYAYYENNQEVAYVIFNGSGSDINSWFDKHRIIASSYTDLTTTQKYNFFSVVGNYVPKSRERRFFINTLYNTCAGDSGYLVVSEDEPPNNLCSWDKHASYPQFLYSKINSVDLWGSQLFGRADYMAIFVKTE